MPNTSASSGLARRTVAVLILPSRRAVWLTWPVVGLADGVPSSGACRATNASTAPRSSRWAGEKLTRRMPLPRPRRPLGCDPLPNRGWCHNSGKNEIGCGNRCRRRARRSSARHRAALALWDTSHRNEMQCRYGVGTPDSGTGKLDPVH